MPAAVTVPDASLMVMVPAVPPAPIVATSPLTHVALVRPSVQFVLSTSVFQNPLPSTGAAGVAPLESQVCTCPNETVGKSAAATGAIASVNHLTPQPRRDFRSAALLL